MKIKIEVDGYECGRCHHKWVSRKKHLPPIVCPKCKSPYWDKERTKEMVD